MSPEYPNDTRPKITKFPLQDSRGNLYNMDCLMFSQTISYVMLIL